MAHIIGTDEAGYGPNLGPLVITATLWRVPDAVPCERLYQVLDGVIAPMPVAGSDAAPRLVIADSKRVYAPGRGLAGLERTVLGVLRMLGHDLDLWSEVWDALVPDVLPRLGRIPWYARHDEPIPIDATADEIIGLAERATVGLEAAGVRLLAVESDAIFPAEWNRLLRLHESKGAALSHRSIALARRALDRLDGEDDAPVAIICDKHGGRNRYARLLGEHFPESLIEIHGESRQRSTYRFGSPGRRVECCFTARAESLLPVALASMTSKYLRELAMRAMNGFWAWHVADLRPTAGYPVDARRFKEAITPVQIKLGIDDDLVWRER